MAFLKNITHAHPDPWRIGLEMEEGTDEYTLFHESLEELTPSDDDYLKRLIANQSSEVVECVLQKMLNDYVDSEDFEKPCLLIHWVDLIPPSVVFNDYNMTMAILAADRVDLLKQLPSETIKNIDYESFRFGGGLECFKYLCGLGIYTVDEDDAYTFALSMCDDHLEYFYENTPPQSLEVSLELLGGNTRNGGYFDFSKKLLKDLIDRFPEHHEEIKDYISDDYEYKELLEFFPKVE